MSSSMPSQDREPNRLNRNPIIDQFSHSFWAVANLFIKRNESVMSKNKYCFIKILSFIKTFALFIQEK